MSKSIVDQISSNLIFKYQFPCLETEKKWSKSVKLDEKYRLPFFGEFDDQNLYADVRMGWRPDGLLCTCDVTDKKKSLWCRGTQLLESDSLQLWIDTRNTQNVHRATKYCHWFLFMPTGSGGAKDQPLATMLKINRSKEDPGTMNRSPISIASKVTAKGYSMKAFIPAACMNGWDTDEHRKIGFSVAVVDREFGWQTLAAGPELPIAEDPSLWHTLELK